MVPRARLLAAAGFSVLLFDFQAHGESTGDRITFGRLEGLDARAAVAFVRGAPSSRAGRRDRLLARRRRRAARAGPAAGRRARARIDLLGDRHRHRQSDQRHAPDRGRNRRAAAGMVVRGVAAAHRRRAPGRASPDRSASPRSLRRSWWRPARSTIARPSPKPTPFSPAPRSRNGSGGWKALGHVDLEAYAPDEYRRRVLPFLAERLRQQH